MTTIKIKTGGRGSDGDRNEALDVLDILQAARELGQAHCCHWYDDDGPCCRCGDDGDDEASCGR